MRYEIRLRQCFGGQARDKGGFTLLELLIYTAVLSFVIVLSAQFTLGVFEATIKSAAKEEVQQNTANIIQAFNFETRSAQAIYTLTSDFIGDPGQLSLITTRNPAADETVSHLDMYLDSGRVCVKREISGVSCITSSGVEVTSLTFERAVQPRGAESVRIRFIIRNRSPKAEFQFAETVQTSARLRSF